MSYTFTGSPSGQDFRDRPGASLGPRAKLSDAFTISSLVDWRRAIVSARERPT